jgi:glycosyltransferase involved in cell wall biosynthesis
MLNHPLYFAGRPGGQFGWGVCNQYLLHELSRQTSVVLLAENTPEWSSPSLPGHLFTPLGDHHLQPVTPARGRFNHGYTFFENELNDQSLANAQRLDIIFAGCTWCQQRLAEKGIHNSKVLVQGVDTNIFHPAPAASVDNRFVIFSGGKFEFRKGQDLVLRAIQILQQRHPDILLVNAWCNQWPYSMATMAYSPYIKFETTTGSWQEQMKHLYQINHLDPQRIMTMPLLAQDKMARIYHLSDLGLFPNRCEGGTNLVMMEYMACGKPVVASFTTGHCDVLSDENAFVLKSLRNVNIQDNRGVLTARWQEPLIEDIVAQVEYAYQHRDEAHRRATRAAQDMGQLTWERTAGTILQALGGY